ncbi:ATP-grasp domain-containing protein [Phyllobacterium sp. YR531]|uniref:ATP-grasp domain-containing protein n=1 Tax=Phyllobacterium sp. YR531 TaxID=1144343 RepID=UPI00026F5AFD|nr:ATP-grasp domain-containing protein [Phyllobacterium sp. YR531]EJN05653.1 biotin carboxylase [Phyllobacterium sp. YR531]
MSKHLLIVDSNVPGFDTIQNASDAGIIVSFIRSNYRLYTVTENVIRTVYGVANVISIDDPTSLDQVKKAMSAIHNLLPVDGVITQLEACVDVVAQACADLGIRFTNARAVANARDKAKARELIEAVGIRSARCRIVSTPDEAAQVTAEFGCPVIVKPQTGYDSLLAYPAHSPEQAASATNALLNGIKDTPRQIHSQLQKGVLVEELLVGELVSVELGVKDGKFYRFMVSGRPRSKENECIEMGATMPADISSELREECFFYAESVVTALGLDIGIFHIEMILTKRGPTLVEVNPRLMGGVMPGMYKHLTSDDISKHLINIHLDLPVEAPELDVRDFITSRKLMPRNNGQLAGQIDVSWAAATEGLIHFDPYALRPGQEVKANQVLARYQIRRNSLDDAGVIADELLDRFEVAIGIPLIR